MPTDRVAPSGLNADQYMGAPAALTSGRGGRERSLRTQNTSRCFLMALAAAPYDETDRVVIERPVASDERPEIDVDGDKNDRDIEPNKAVSICRSPNCHIRHLRCFRSLLFGLRRSRRVDAGAVLDEVARPAFHPLAYLRQILPYNAQAKHQNGPGDQNKCELPEATLRELTT